MTQLITSTDSANSIEFSSSDEIPDRISPKQDHANNKLLFLRSSIQNKPDWLSSEAKETLHENGLADFVTFMEICGPLENYPLDGLETLTKGDFAAIKDVDPTSLRIKSKNNFVYDIDPVQFLSLYLEFRQKYPNLDNTAHVLTHLLRLAEFKDKLNIPQNIKNQLITAYQKLDPEEQCIFNLYALLKINFDALSIIQKSCTPKILEFLAEVLPSGLKKQWELLLTEKAISPRDLKIISGFLEISKNWILLHFNTPERTKELGLIFNMIYEAFQNKAFINLFPDESNLSEIIQMICMNLSTDYVILLSKVVFTSETTTLIDYNFFANALKGLEISSEKTRKILEHIETFASKEVSKNSLENKPLLVAIILSQTTNASFSQILKFMKKHGDTLETEKDNIEFSDFLSLQCLEGKMTDFKQIEETADELLKKALELSKSLGSSNEASEF